MKHFPEHIDQTQLNDEITKLKNEIDHVEKDVNDFILKIRSHIMNELIEVQELTVLYKKLKKAKKEKRFEQKKKGKHYQEPTGLKTIQKTEISSQENKEEQTEKKRLYREAMLYVHPDKFSIQDGSEDSEDLATEITSKLIEIYQTGSLAELKAYHAHIFNGNINLLINENKVITNTENQYDYLISQIEKLKKQLEEVKNSQLYKVLTEYKNPLTFLNELKEYYTDRVMKLRKRTRKA